MSNSFLLRIEDQSAGAVKGFWEDPSIILERDLEARAQGGPPGSPDQSVPRGVLGPFSTPDPSC